MHPSKPIEPKPGDEHEKRPARLSAPSCAGAGAALVRFPVPALQKHPRAPEPSELHELPHDLRYVLLLDPNRALDDVRLGLPGSRVQPATSREL